MKIKLLAVIACIFWGSAFAGGKIGFEYATPLYLSGLRFTLAGLLLIPLLVVQHVDWRASFKEWRYMLVFAMIQTFMQYGLFFMGLSRVPAAISAIIIGAGPLFVALMAHFFMPNDKLTWRKSIAIGVGLMGIVFISLTKGGALHVDNSFYLGVFCLIVSNFVGGSTNIIVARNRTRVSPIMLTSFANFTGGLLLFIISLFIEEGQLKPFTLEFYGAWLWLSMIPAVAFSIWYTILKRPEVKVSELNVWKFVVPVTGVVLSWILLPDESPDMYSIIGISIIVLALFILRAKFVSKKQDLGA